MADFDPPFASSGERRFPTSIEQSHGIPCGPLDRTLFNGIFHLLNGNIGRVIQEAGITGPDGDLTKLLRAIETLIAAATGSSSSGDTSQFVTFPQARARLPIYPEVITSDGRMGIFSPGTGQVRIPGGVTFIHRGIWLVTTTQTDIATDASKTYHLRWNPTDGFVLRDLASGTYNPSALPEADPLFDSAFDDMLVARIVTNSSNVPTVTNLSNSNRLMLTERATGSPAPGGPPADASLYFTGNITIGWARTPILRHVSGGLAADPTIRGSMDWGANMIQAAPIVTRYGASATIRSDWQEGTSWFSGLAYLDFSMAA